MEISHTGTSVSFKPGIIKGGVIGHECDLMKPIGYYLDPLLALAPFSKFAFKLTLTGITTSMENGTEPSVLILVALISRLTFFAQQPFR